MPDGAPELHYMETMSYEEYLSALVPKDREYDRYAGAWNEMLAESLDAFLGLGLIYKAVTGEEAFTGDKLTQNEREESAASGAFALTVSVLTSAIGGTGWSGFATMLLADAAGGVVGVVTYEGLTNMGLSDSEAFLLSFFAGVVTGNGIERMAYSSPTYIDDLAKRMGKSSDEVADMLGDLSDVAAKYNYSSVDDMLNNLSPAARDDIMKMFDKPLGSFDLDKVDDFKVKNQVYRDLNADTAIDIGYMKNNADPMREAVGSGRVSSPEEWNSIIQDLEKNGVEITYREGSMAYAPGLTDGSPGQLVIDPDASLSALRHEYQHFLDAQADGFPSFGKQMFEDPKTRVIKELRAYLVEIKEADRLGLKEVSEQLFENYRQEREWITNQYIAFGGE